MAIKFVALDRITKCLLLMKLDPDNERGTIIIQLPGLSKWSPSQELQKEGSPEDDVCIAERADSWDVLGAGAANLMTAVCKCG